MSTAWFSFLNPKDYDNPLKDICFSLSSQVYKPYFQLKPFIHYGDIAKQKENSTIIAAWQHISLLGNKIHTNLFHALMDYS